MTAASDSDLVLLRRYADSQDAESFLEITKRHAAMVYAVARRVTGNVQDAEDVSQACFLELARRACDVRTCVGGWLHRVAVRRSQNFRRDAAVRQRYERLQQHSTALSAEAEWDEIAPLLHTALGGLPDDLRLPLVLLYLQGRTQQDVATELAVSQATVSRRASEGIEHLRTTLRRMGVQAAAAAMIGGLAADSQAAVPAALRESLGNLALSGIGSSPTPAKAGWSVSPVWILLVAVSAVVGLSLILFNAEAVIRPNSIVQLPNALKMPIRADRDTELPLMGALTDAARIMGRNVGYTELMGDSSLAFITRWYRLSDQPSVQQDAPWDSVGYLVYTGNSELRLLETSLGISLQSHVSSTDFDTTGIMASIVTALRAGQCAVGYLASARPEAAEGCSQAHVVLIVGADPEQERLLLRYDDRERPTWHAAADLAPRFLIPLENREPLARRDALIAALRAAVNSWDSPPEKADEVVAMCVHRDTHVYSGWRAYDTWIQDLRQNLTGTSERSQHVRAVSQWSFDLLRRGRRQAAIYLCREAQQFSGQQQNHLLRAADLYSRFVEETTDDLFSQATLLVTTQRPTLVESASAADKSVRTLDLARQLDAKAIREFQTFLRTIPDPSRRVAKPGETAPNEAGLSL